MESFLERAFAVPFERLGDQIVNFLPDVLAMLVILGVGVMVAIAVRLVVARTLRLIGFDDFVGNIGLQATLFRANIHQTPSQILAGIVYGIIVFLALLLGISALNLPFTENMLGTFFMLIPRLIVATIILVAGYLLSKFVSRSVLIAAVNAEVRAARWIPYAVQILIFVFTISVSLEQVGLAQIPSLRRSRSFSVAWFSVLP